jgi:hypothetical protein
MKKLIIILIILISFGNISCTESFSKEAQESAPKFIADMKETGLIYDYNWESTTIFVDPYKWNNLTIDQKEKAGAIFAAYFEYRTGNAFANIKDKYSGHKLNSYVWGWGLE